MTADNPQLRTMQLADYSRAIKLWQQSDGVQLRDADSIDAIGRFLSRNPGLSFVAESKGVLIATVLAGHDGRRGYLHHLAVDREYRRQGIASLLLETALKTLRSEGIDKIHIMVQANNVDAMEFWRARGFGARNDITLMSYTTSGLSNA